MSSIKSKERKPEIIVCEGLWSMGFRYRLNSLRLSGHLDLVLRKYRTCIFVNGCFWHGHHVEFPSSPSCVPLVASEQSSSATGSGTAKGAIGQERIGIPGYSQFTVHIVYISLL